MYSNLYKANRILLQEEGTRVIDHNDRLEQKIREAALHNGEEGPHESGTEEDGFSGGIHAASVDALLDPEGPGSVIKGGLSAEKEALLAEIEEARKELAAVKEQADQMMAEAEAQIEKERSKAYEEASQQGYEEGRKRGLSEAEELKKECARKEQELIRDYQKKIEELEPEFVRNLTDIYEHIFKVDLKEYQGLIANLLISTMQKTDVGRNVLVHIAREDYPKVMADKERILSETGGQTFVEFTEDATLPSGQCFIESENGIYDCGLDTQLAELKRKLTLLSYTK